jgi:hypothetical protein
MMTPEARIEFSQALTKCAEELQSTLIKKTGMVQVQCSRTDRRKFAGPALRHDFEFAGVDFNDFPRWLFGGPDQAEVEIVANWNECVLALINGNKTFQTARRLYPNCPFTGSVPPTATLAQVLCVMWWSGGTFLSTGSESYLHIGRSKFGLDLRTTWYENRRWAHGIRNLIHPRQYLIMPMGKMRNSTAELTGVYRHLLKHLPQLASVTDVMCSAAVAAGVEYQKLITQLFDFEFIDVEHPSAGVWNDARSLVTSATSSPRDKLWPLLKGLVPYRTFLSRFGNPNRKKTAYYSAKMRQRHLDALNELESNVTTDVYVGESAQAAHALLKFQQMMGMNA